MYREAVIPPVRVGETMLSDHGTNNIKLSRKYYNLNHEDYTLGRKDYTDILMDHCKDYGNNLKDYNPACEHCTTTRKDSKITSEDYTKNRNDYSACRKDYTLGCIISLEGLLMSSLKIRHCYNYILVVCALTLGETYCLLIISQQYVVFKAR